MKQKMLSTFILISSCVASLGTYPYAKAFAASLFTNQHYSGLLALVLVPAAVFSNIALGAYSLHNSLFTKHNISTAKNTLILILATLSALSTGFMCFVGYRTKFPDYLNLIVSLMVVVVNAGIGFSAINNAMSDVLQATQDKKRIVKTIKRKPMQFFVGCVSVIFALSVTLTAYLASTHGLASIVNYLNFSTDHMQKLIYLLAMLIWFPGAILFANASRHTVLKFYEAVTYRRLNISLITLVICLVAFLSGSAYAQMALEFFNVCKQIPDLFKSIAGHSNLVFYVYMPMAFFVSAVVNGYALINLIKEVKKNNKKLIVHF